MKSRVTSWEEDAGCLTILISDRGLLTPVLWQCVIGDRSIEKSSADSIHLDIAETFQTTVTSAGKVT